MEGRKSRRGTVSLRAAAFMVLLIAAALIAPTTGLAAEPPAGVSSTVQVADTQLSATSSVTCPPKTQVQAVGVASTVNNSQALAVNQMVPSPTGVSVRGVNLPGNASQLTSIAYCAKVQVKKKKAKKGATSAKKKKKKKKKNPLVQVSATTSLSGVSTGAATATCPSGTTVRTGGFDTGPGGDVYQVAPIAGELIAPNQWRVTADTAGAPGDSITAVAICARGPTVTASTAATEFVSPDPQWAVAKCPFGSVAFGGFNTGGSGSSVYLSGLERIADAAWRTTVYPTAPGTVTSIAYCA
jgi:hypothetical protein